MAKNGIEWVSLNHAGVRELLKSAEMQKALSDLATGIAGRAGDGYEHDTKQMPTRVIASAYTATKEAMRDTLDNNTLLKAVK